MGGCWAGLDRGHQHRSGKALPAQSMLGRRGEGHTGTGLVGKAPPGDVAVLAVSPNFAGWGAGAALPFGPVGIPTSELNEVVTVSSWGSFPFLALASLS